MSSNRQKILSLIVSIMIINGIFSKLLAEGREIIKQDTLQAQDEKIEVKKIKSIDIKRNISDYAIGLKDKMKIVIEEEKYAMFLNDSGEEIYKYILQEGERIVGISEKYIAIATRDRIENNKPRFSDIKIIDQKGNIIWQIENTPVKYLNIYPHRLHRSSLNPLFHLQSFFLQHYERQIRHTGFLFYLQV